MRDANIAAETNSNTNPEIRRHSGVANAVFWWHTGVLVICVSLFALILKNTGLTPFTEMLVKIGWGFLLLVVFDGLRHLLRAWTIYMTIPPELRNLKFRHVLAARMAGEAVSLLTFTGPLLGEITKATMLNRRISAIRIGAAIALENLIFYFSVALLILAGIVSIKLFFEPRSHMRAFLVGVAAVDLLFIYGVISLFVRRAKPLSWLIGKLSSVAPQFAARQTARFESLESNFFLFTKNRRKIVFLVMVICFITHAIGVAEVYFALQMSEIATDIRAAFVIESLTKVVNSAFTFVPGAIGVYEGGNGIILRSLGYGAAAGVALALVRRGATLVWTGVGLFFLFGGMISRKSDSRIGN